MGQLTLAVTKTSAAVNLTTVGILDWSQWGATSVTTRSDSKSGAGSLPNPTLKGAGAVFFFSGDPRTVNWTDGTTTPTSSSSNGIYNNGATSGCGWQMVLPADTNVRTVFIYIGGFSLTTAATVTASLSDGSASSQTDSTTMTGAASTSIDGVVRLDYQANSSGQSLTLQWYINSSTGNVTLQGAALNANSSGSPDVTVGLAAQSMTATQAALGSAHSVTLSALSVTASQGALGLSSSRVLNSLSATMSQSALGVSNTIGLSSLTGTFSQGTITASQGGNLTIGLSAQSMTATQANLGAQNTIGLTALSSTLSQGSLGSSHSIAIAAQSATFTQSALGPNTTIGLIAQSATFTQGTLGVSAGSNVTIALGAQTITASQASVGLQSTLALGSQSATLSQGTVGVANALALAGQSAAFTQGQIGVSAAGDITIALVGQTATFSQGALTPSGSTPLIQNVGAGRSRRAIYFVTIDGVRFECRTIEEALQLLAKAKQTAKKLAEDQAMWAVNLQRESAERIPPPKVEAPKIEVSSRELRKAASETKREIQTIYEQEAATAEIRMLMELSKRQADDDDILSIFLS